MAKKKLKKTSPSLQNFRIEKMDGLGQGVDKQQGKVSFIAKTLPGEEGQATVFKRSKGVTFATLKRLDKKADNRISPQCPHFSSCPGCHYLHTDYDSELNYKRQSLQDLFRHFSLPEQGIEVVAAPERLHYRNRLQLHYRHNYLGMLDAATDNIIEIPQCQIIRPELQQAFDDLYNKKPWLDKKNVSGHVELYWRDDVLSVQWDERYSHGGFTQVYAQMNALLCEQVEHFIRQLTSSSLLDLFSGKGNLSNAITAEKNLERLMVDYSSDGDESDFICLDLFSEDALKRFGKKTSRKNFDVFVVDPPRKGFPLLAQWVKRYKPKALVYVSCNASTLARDLQKLTEAGISFRIAHLQLLDLFPATHHYETVAYLYIDQAIKK